jgi:serine phosphatase RsbU (regulator of sigma subunit)
MHQLQPLFQQDTYHKQVRPNRQPTASLQIPSTAHIAEFFWQSLFPSITIGRTRSTRLLHMDQVAEISVRDLMATNPVVVPPSCTVQEVLRLMNQHRIGAVIVGAEGKLQGIFSERDFLKQAVEAPPGWRPKPVSEWMTPYPHTIGPDASWEDAVALMEARHVRHLPVIEHGKIIGILSARQLMSKRNEYLNQVVEERTQELQRIYDIVSARDKELRLNMAIAARLQKRLLLPGAPPGWPEISWGIHFAPLDLLGGDYYDFAVPNDHQLGILIADASGHSIAAAMVAIMARFAFTEVARHSVKPSSVLSVMNRRLQGLTDERFVTAFFGVLDRRTREFRYANAGHPPQLRYCPRTGKVEHLTQRGLMLGILPHANYDEHTVVLEPGDRLLFFTDGVLDCRNLTKEPFGVERLEGFLRKSGHLPAAVLTQTLVDRLTDFRSDQPAWDDLTILVAEVAE